MSQETINMLLAGSTMFFIGIQPIVLLYVIRSAKAVGKIADIEITAELAKQIEGFAIMAINYAQEQTHKFLKGLSVTGPMSAEEKKAVAIDAMATMTKHAGLNLDYRQAEIAIEAAVYKQRSIAPPPPPAGSAAVPVPGEIGTSYQSLRPLAEPQL